MELEWEETPTKWVLVATPHYDSVNGRYIRRAATVFYVITQWKVLMWNNDTHYTDTLEEAKALAVALVRMYD